MSCLHVPDASWVWAKEFMLAAGGWGWGGLGRGNLDVAKRQKFLCLSSFGLLQDKLQIPGPNLDHDTASCVTSGEVHNLSDFSFLHLESGEQNTFLGLQR